MRGTDVGTSGDRSTPTHLLMLDALDEVLIVVGRPSFSTNGSLAVCRMLARLVDAPAAAHVRYHVSAGRATLTVWRQRTAPTALKVDERCEYPTHGHDWWTTSATRRAAFDALDQRHLAELPLDPAPDQPTIVLAGRDRPFSDADSERLASAHRALYVVERIVDRLGAQRIQRLGADTSPGAMSPLTDRELEVLAMLSEGLLARSIAQRLEVSERTVHKHLGNLYRKLDAHDRLLAVRRAESLGLLPSAQAAGW